MNTITITIFNAIGLPKHAITPILEAAQSTSLLLITETWLLSPARYPTNWKQFHTYGIPVEYYNNRSSQGICLLVNPNCKHHIHYLSPPDSPLIQYQLSFTIADTLVHCLYLPPSLDNHTVLAILSSLPLTAPNTRQTVICGDLNARLGSYTGDRSANSRGNTVYRWMMENNIITWNQRLAYGQPMFLTHQGSSIIDLFLSTTELTEPAMTVFTDKSLGSNHKMVSLMFKTTVPYQPTQMQRNVWNLGKLKEPEVQKAYIQHIQAALVSLGPSNEHTWMQTANKHVVQQHIEEYNQSLCKIIYDSLDITCGQIIQSKNPLRSFWTDDILQALDIREHYYRKWRKAYGLNKLRYWIKHQEACAQLKRLIHRRRRETWNKFCHQMATGEYTKAIAKISKIRKRRTLKPTFSTPQGPKHSADTMATHLETVFSGDLLQGAKTYEVASPILPFEAECPFDVNLVQNAINNLPIRKAPGIDHLRNEMLRPIQHLLAPVLLELFRLCWRWSYTPQAWRIAQVVPIHKKGNPSDANNYRPISLTSVLRKILERCIEASLQEMGPPLDIAQGGFRRSRSALDQALCLSEICHSLRIDHNTSPVLAFLDIKSVYDTVNRDLVWHALQQYLPSPLLGLLRNLFDEVLIEVLLSNTSSRRFHPRTGVLQGSILSPYLYLIYINQLPTLLRPREFTTDLPPRLAIPLLNCLLYADDVVLIANQHSMAHLLKICEQHSIDTGYRWNPTKCVILDNPSQPIEYKIYNQAIPRLSSFAYLGVPFKPGGFLDPDALVNRNCSKAFATMNMLTSIGVNPTGFSKLLSSRFYAQIVRSQMEYSLAINLFSNSQLRRLEDTQNKCIQKIYGAHDRSSTKVMLHLAKLPTMNERVRILQAQFLFRSLYVPGDSLLGYLLPHIQYIRGYQWSNLSKTALWQLLPTPHNSLTICDFRSIKRDYLQQGLQQRMRGYGSKLLSFCRPKLSINPILWIPMTHRERSRCIRWRLGWLPNGRLRPCPIHRSHMLTRSHAIECLRMHHRLRLSLSIPDPLSFSFNKLPTVPHFSARHIDSWQFYWPIICSILSELDQLQHSYLPQESTFLGRRFLRWLDKLQ